MLLRSFIVLSFIFLSISQIVAQGLMVPYNNNFDNISTDTVGWTHYASTGTDDWEIGMPADPPVFASAYSYPNVWMTNLSGNFAANSDRSLETPYFDLTNTAVDYVLSFRYKSEGSSGTTYFMEYSVAGGAWQVLDDAMALKNNWQNPSTGFVTWNSTSSFRYAAIQLTFLQGQDSVKFRYRFNCGSSNGSGWMIDNFSIGEEYNNVYPQPGDSVTGINQYYSDFTVKTSLIFQNQWNSTYLMYNDFYFSTDTILDASDIYLGNDNYNGNGGIANWINTFPLPSGLTAGTYYTLINTDVLDNVNEADEVDNLGYVTIVLDSIYASNYVEDFDTSIYRWNTKYGVTGSQWTKGDANNWHVEDPRSGDKGWFSGTYVQYETYLESPFMDLTGTTNNTICFWYRNSSSTTPSLQLQLPTYNTATITDPVYSTTINIPQTRTYGWDCRCESLTNYDNEVSTRFRFNASGNIVPTTSSTNQTLIDDVYIGEARPDVSIDNEKKNHYTSTLIGADTLDYYLFNSGLSTLPATTTEFYWSADSLLDASDVFLGSQSEPSIGDTNYVIRQFPYTKPTTASGKYYIFYSVDASNTVAEMREYDNIGYIEIYQTNGIIAPYFNDFETNTDGWRHNASLGQDDWQCAQPNGAIIDSAFSGNLAFVTNPAGLTSNNSRMHLFSPVIDVSQLQNPVLEFDMMSHYYGYGYSYWPYNMGNVMYSTDGGNTWINLETQNESYKKWYSRISFASISGIDQILLTGTTNSSILYGWNLKHFRSYLDYQGRDYEDNTHYVIDLGFLEGETRVQFMIVYANYNAPTEGMLIDNFNVREAEIDLMIPSTKKLMVSSGDAYIKTYFKVKNNNNYISDTTALNIYCSADTLLDATDAFICQKPLYQIRPYQSYLIDIVEPAPANLGNYQYLLYEIDPGGLIAENNEVNNIGYLDLAMDSCVNYQYPVQFDFEASEIDGWTWYHDSIGYYHGHRFRNHILESGDATCTNQQNGVMFLEVMDQGGYSTSYSGYPHHYLEGPAWDFSSLSDIQLSFDFVCVGNNWWSNSQGGNLEYSTDGGQTWTVLTAALDPYAQNWYNLSSINSLGGEPGWGNFPSWSTASFNLSFLAGESNVRLRFKFRSEFMSSGSSIHGFRLDNFNIEGESVDLKAMDIHPTVNADIYVPNFTITYDVENQGTIGVPQSRTFFYWSNDTLYDSSDPLLYDVPEGFIAAGAIITETRLIYYPIPVTQDTMYLLYVVDGDSNIVEAEEANNLGWIVVVFNELSAIDLYTTPQDSVLYVDSNSVSFPFVFNFINNGNMNSIPSEIDVTWSTDTIPDVGDYLLYTVNEPVLSGQDLIMHSGDVYYPHPILQDSYYLILQSDVMDSNSESDEGNNFTVVEIVFDTVGLAVGTLELSDIYFGSTETALSLSFSELRTDPAFISILTSTGQLLVDRKEVIPSNNTYILEKPIMSTGVYFLSFQSGNQVHTFKFYHHAN